MTSLYNNSITRYYDFVFKDLGDTRTNDWLLLGSPMPGLTILGLYLYFVLSWGPRYMLHRKPYDLQNVLIIYNFIQVLVSIWIFWEAMDAAWWSKYSWRCEPVDWSRSPAAMRIAWGYYIYFLAKISELLDTVFFVLRKKDRQITFLHMYHHTVMPMVSWGAAKYYPGGHGSFIGMINSFVHIIMYTYYMMAAMGPQYQKYLWWKKYITTLQLSQFCLAFLHSFQLLIYDCEYPRWTLFLIMPNAIFFYYLFNDFYNKAYSCKLKLKSKSINNNNQNNIDKQMPSSSTSKSSLKKIQ
ncbi:very long chain fatty acid elongase AAEL008004-like [Lycorma delicatula]|uniref:very long chain fatty acid elongase AAEL008004-like n=1 Tax=Lycorma delicatula TaxID=130591 RepID=UPI003F51A250